jgi:hypothetical protein
LKKIGSLKTPNTNIAVIQKIVFLKYKTLYQFLVDRFPEIAVEIKVNYVNTVSLYYIASFERYLKIVSKGESIHADKLDLMGSDESVVRKGGMFHQSRNIKDKASVFTLGNRRSVLDDGESGIILGDIPVKYPYEAIFRSIHCLMLDNGSSEYCFNR